MNPLAAGDILFYGLALGALVAAAASMLSASLLRSAEAALAAAALLALLFARVDASGLAALQVALVVVAAVVLLLVRGALRREDGDRAKLLRSAAMPLAAWLVLVLRVVLMTRWPVDGERVATTWTSPGLLHHLVLALALLALALLAAASRRSIHGAAVAAASAGSAVALALAALSHFTAAGAPLMPMAAIALGSTWLAAAAAIAMTADDAAAPLSPSFSAGLSTAVAGLALALLAGTW